MSENEYQNLRKFLWCLHTKTSSKISEFSKSETFIGISASDLARHSNFILCKKLSYFLLLLGPLFFWDFGTSEFNFLRFWYFRCFLIFWYFRTLLEYLKNFLRFWYVTAVNLATLESRWLFMVISDNWCFSWKADRLPKGLLPKTRICESSFVFKNER